MWELERFNDNIAVKNDKKVTVTYGEINEFSREMKDVIGGRCLVFLLCKNTVGAVAGYIAFVNNGMVPVLLNANLERELLDNLLNIYNPKYIWIPEEKKDSFNKVDVVYSKWEYILIKTNFNITYDLYSDLCLMLTTSGSTGSPRLVKQSYNNVKSNAESIVEYLQLDETEKPITTLPMNYTYGLSIINSHLLVGATLLLTEKTVMQKAFWTFFKEEQATSFGGVPYTYEMLDKLHFSKMKLYSLRYTTQAGGKLTPELHKKFAENAKLNKTKFIVMYGQCEATARMGYLPAEYSIKKCGSMGIAIPNGKFSLIDVEGNVITKPNTIGELVYEGPNVTLGYAECGADLIKGDERNGILMTGDMAQFDEDGFYYIVGRKKRFLKIFGTRVNLDEIDRLVKTKFDNIDFASSGIDDHMYLFVTSEKIAVDVREFVVFKTGLNQSAFKAIVINEIPKNDSGKTLYKELEKYYAE